MDEAAQVDQAKFLAALAEIRANKAAIDEIAKKNPDYPYIYIIAASPQTLPNSQDILGLTPGDIRTAANNMQEEADKTLALELATQHELHLQKVHSDLLAFRRAMRNEDLCERMRESGYNPMPQSGSEARKTLWHILYLVLRSNDLDGTRHGVFYYLPYVTPEQIARDFVTLEKTNRDLKEVSSEDADPQIARLGRIGKLAEPFDPANREEIHRAAKIKKNYSIDPYNIQHQSYWSFFREETTAVEKAAAIGTIPAGFLVGVFAPVWMSAGMVTIPTSIALCMLALIVAGAALWIKSFNIFENISDRHDEYIDRQYANLPAAVK